MEPAARGLYASPHPVIRLCLDRDSGIPFRDCFVISIYDSEKEKQSASPASFARKTSWS